MQLCFLCSPIAVIVTLPTFKGNTTEISCVWSIVLQLTGLNSYDLFKTVLQTVLMCNVFGMLFYIISGTKK